MIKNSEVIDTIRNLNAETIKKILLFKGVEQDALFSVAKDVRNNGKFGNKVELRSVIEISNICSQNCRYCSMGKNKNNLYTLSAETIIERIKQLAEKGRRTFLLQSGENHNQKFIDNLSFCCESVLNLYPDINIILCLGNLSEKQYAQLKRSGAKRYILKFETSNPELHKFCRPSDTIQNRLDKIQMLIDMGFQVGSGNITGLPNQTLDDLVEDLRLIKKLDLYMVSSTKFIPNPNSEFNIYPPGDIDITTNFLAVLRILKPDCLIPSTSSLSLGQKNGQARGLEAGCNTVTVHDGTPTKYEKDYTIYSDKRFSPAEEYCRNIILESKLVPVNSLI